jgi:DNA-binding NarL/FixJ family response regulator
LLAIARQIHPDAIILDVEMRGTGAEATVREILRALPKTRVIVLTMHDNPSLVGMLLAAGAAAYVIKGATRETLLAAVRGVRSDDGNVVISVSRETVTRLRAPPASPLSSRELEVLTAVSSGLRNAQIARRLFITEGTVKRHLTNIYMKLDVTTRISAVNKAITMGLIEPREFDAR